MQEHLYTTKKMFILLNIVYAWLQSKTVVTTRNGRDVVLIYLSLIAIVATGAV